MGKVGRGEEVSRFKSLVDKGDYKVLLRIWEIESIWGGWRERWGSGR